MTKEIVENPEVEEQDTIPEPVNVLPDAEVPEAVPIDEFDGDEDLPTDETVEPEENQNSPQDDEATEDGEDE